MQRRRKRKFPFIQIATLALCGVVFWLYSGLNGTIEFAENTTIVIKEGTSVSSLADKLEEQEAIKSAFIFKLYAKYKNLDSSLQTGTFSVSGDLSTPELLNVLTGQPNNIVFTIQEGLMIREIDQKPTNEGHISDGEFIQAVQNFDNYDRYPFIEINSNTYPQKGTFILTLTT